MVKRSTELISWAAWTLHVVAEASGANERRDGLLFCGVSGAAAQRAARRDSGDLARVAGQRALLAGI